MLIIVQIGCAIIAAVRGWRFVPILIMLGCFGFGLLGGFVIGKDAIPFLTIIDWIVTGILLVMAVSGKKKPAPMMPPVPPAPSPEGRIKCPYCAELIVPEAKFCRFCGRELRPAATVENPMEQQ